MAFGGALRSTAWAALAVLVSVGSGEAQGARPSPLDSASAFIEGADIDIQYGRPSMRGRTIYGGLVPWGRVWRTGANEATHFRTSADLMMAGETIPAGHYTLFTIPEEDGWTLIINGQTGQWGTDYNPSEDVIRLPMSSVDAVDEAVETFTISVGPGGGSDGLISFVWENTKAVMEFSVGGG